MTDANLRRVRELIAEVRTRLDDKYDVDTIVGDGTVTRRESPYTGAAYDLRVLDMALRLLDDAIGPTLSDGPPIVEGARSPLVQVDPEDAGTSFPVFASRSD